MIARRRNPLSILGLVASDASYYKEGTRKPGDLLRSLGGDLAYQYGRNGSVAGIGFGAAAAVVSAPEFATAPQALQPAASLQRGTHRLA